MLGMGYANWPMSPALQPLKQNSLKSKIPKKLIEDEIDKRSNLTHKIGDTKELQA